MFLNWVSTSQSPTKEKRMTSFLLWTRHMEGPCICAAQMSHTAWLSHLWKPAEVFTSTQMCPFDWQWHSNSSSPFLLTWNNSLLYPSLLPRWASLSPGPQSYSGTEAAVCISYSWVCRCESYSQFCIFLIFSCDVLFLLWNILTFLPIGHITKPHLWP